MERKHVLGIQMRAVGMLLGVMGIGTTFDLLAILDAEFVIPCMVTGLVLYVLGIMLTWELYAEPAGPSGPSEILAEEREWMKNRRRGD